MVYGKTVHSQFLMQEKVVLRNLKFIESEIGQNQKL